MEENSKPKTELSTEPYKGVRDFYPEDMAVQNYIFDTWKKVAKEAGYLEYSASILEPAELYRSKTSSEIVNYQTFSFIDRGDREVVLRPEMTPTLARMIAGRRRSLKFPLRWFSIPNGFRNEKPQRGRKREHWQLNCDLLGIADTSAEVEIISLAYNIMKAFGAKDEDFIIKINDRKKILKGIREKGASDEQEASIISLLDKKEKLSPEEFKDQAKTILGEVLDLEFEEGEDTKEILEKLNEKGIKNVEFNSSIVRGFNYYTGMVFEVFDTSPENNRSLFGGGRYDNLLEIFGVEPVPTVGFGMGDVTIRDFLETHGLPLAEK
ncbi:MAG TPA: ATP phosphoribosyltransferase regulatory subunit [Candidatus Paceibacterota bacterium]